MIDSISARQVGADNKGVFAHQTLWEKQSRQRSIEETLNTTAPRIILLFITTSTKHQH